MKMLLCNHKALEILVFPNSEWKELYLNLHLLKMSTYFNLKT